MEEKQRIKVTIAERQYPLTIHPSEEEYMRIAVGRIRALVDSYKTKFRDRDIQDAFVCFVELFLMHPRYKTETS